MFRFKRFNVSQDLCAMKVGTDGVLLGAWAEGGTHILDIGTGTGLIALMMAQRFPQARITAIDIDSGACLQAQRNIEESPYAGQINVLEKSIQNYTEKAISENTLFDSIVCNPPFFINSLKAPDCQRSLAPSNGTFSCILPTEQTVPFLTEATLLGLSITRRTDIKTTPAKAPKRTLLELRQGFQPKIATETVVLQTAEGNRSTWYEMLTSDFYLF